MVTLPALAQGGFTTVSGTVTDPNGIPWSGGTITAELVVPGGAAPLLNGQIFTGVTASGLMGPTGSFIMRLADNGVILPSGTSWKFTVSIAPSVLPPFGTGSQSFVVTSVINCSANIPATCTSNSINITSILTPVPALTVVFSVAPGSVTHTGALTAAQVVCGNGGADIKVCSPQPSLTYDVRAFGAKCDGVTFDDTAIAAAYTAASLTNPVGWVLYPLGLTCRIGSTVVLPDTLASHTTCPIEAGCVIQAGASMTTMFSKGSGFASAASSIDNVFLDGNLLAAHALTVSSWRDITIDSVYIQDTTDNETVFGDGVSTNLVGLKLRHSHMTYNSSSFPTPGTRPNYNVLIQSPAQDSDIQSNLLTNALQSGIYTTAGNDFIFDNHIFGFPLITYYPNIPIDIEGTAGHRVMANYLDGFSVAGIKTNAQNTMIIGNYFYWQFSGGGQVSGAVPVEMGTSASQSVVASNIARNTLGLTNFITWDGGGIPCATCQVFGNYPAFGGVVSMESDSVNGVQVRVNSNAITVAAVIRYLQNNVNEWDIGLPANSTNYRGRSLVTNQIRFDFVQSAGTFINAEGTSSVCFGCYAGLSTGGIDVRDAGANTGSPTSVYNVDGLTGNTNFLNPVPATGIANQNSIVPRVNANYFNGSISVHDWCGWQDVLGTGTTPTSTWTLACSGTSGARNTRVPYTFNAQFVIPNTGPAFTVANVTPDAKWGSTATVTAAGGSEQRFSFTISSSGTGQATGAPIVLTFPDTWPGFIYYECKFVGGTGSNGLVHGESSAIVSGMTLVYDALPAAGSTYIFNCQGL